MLNNDLRMLALETMKSFSNKKKLFAVKLSLLMAWQVQTGTQNL